MIEKHLQSTKSSNKALCFLNTASVTRAYRYDAHIVCVLNEQKPGSRSWICAYILRSCLSWRNNAIDGDHIAEDGN